MSRHAARLERLDDDHATTAARTGMDRLVCRLGTGGRLIPASSTEVAVVASPA